MSWSNRFKSIVISALLAMIFMSLHDNTIGAFFLGFSLAAIMSNTNIFSTKGEKNRLGM